MTKDDGNDKSPVRREHYNLSELGPKSYDTVVEHTRRWVAWMFVPGSTVVTILVVIGGLEEKFAPLFVYLTVVLYMTQLPLAHFFGKQTMPAPIRKMLLKMAGQSGGTTKQ